MNFSDIIGQLSNSSNPIAMALGFLPNNMKSIFSNIANSKSDQERAQKIADICNKNGITKAQLEAALRQNKV